MATYRASLLQTGSQPTQELPLYYGSNYQGPNSSEDEAAKRDHLPYKGGKDSERSCDGFSLSEKQSVNSVRDSSPRRLVPRMPTHGDRYSRRRMLPSPQESNGMIFINGPRPIQPLYDIPQGWDEDVHPEGQLLYSKIVSSGDLKIRVHTDLPLRLKQNHPIIHSALNRLVNLLDKCHNLHNSGLRGSEIEACIIVREASPDEFGYYLANHQDQTIFWLEDVDPDALSMSGSSSEAAIYQLRLTTQYWRYVTDFPHYCSLPPKVWDQLGPLLLLGVVDQEYSEDSTAPKDAQTLARLETFWRQTKQERDADCNKAACNWICARLWYDFVTPRVHNYWGTNYARLEKTTLIGDDPAPSEMPTLDGAWPGGLIYSKNWTETMELFSSEWERASLLSAVTLIGATTFLALPLSALQSNTDVVPSRVSSIITSFASFCGVTCCALSVSGLVGAVALKRAFRGKITKDVHEAGAYIRSLQNNSSLGYLKWGICFSLPRVLLRWAYVYFC
ncbi:hypothetical protein FRC05_011727 [Tulasnella sp. 425]|nr:hypothetical protein FRC05_011727 [Tulasnella sp. 425]